MNLVNYNVNNDNSTADAKTAPRPRLNAQRQEVTNEILDKEYDKRQQSGILLLHQRDASKAVDPQSISHIVCIGKKLKIYSKNCPIQITSALKDYEERLKMAGFFRVNHNMLVNLHFVEGINKCNKTLTLKEGQKIPVSRRKWTDFWLTLSEISI